MDEEALTVSVRVVGHARTPWKRREDAPHQPSAAAEAEGVIEIAPAYRKALADLATFSRIWVIFRFDRSEGFSLRVKPPRGGPKRGVFATRAPNRPSQLGLSCLELLGVDVDRGEVRVRGIDLLDGTPVLDLKPYVAFVDAHPGAGNGWLDEFLEKGIEPKLKKPKRPAR